VYSILIFVALRFAHPVFTR
jgi:general transcription factor IIIA